jgi:rsbT co-antagonist protein RsbR
MAKEPGVPSMWRALAHVHSAIAALDESGKVVYANPALCALLGCGSSDLEGLDLTAAPFEREREEERAFHERVMHEDGKLEREWQIKSLDGRQLSLVEHASAARLDDERPHRLSTFVDVTLVRELQANLDERQNASLRLLARVMDTAPVMLVAMDVDGLITLADGRASSTLGQGADVIGQSFEEIVKDDSLAKLMTRARSGEEARGAFSVQEGIGFDAWITPMRRRTTGAIAGSMLFALDATERMQTERELRAQLELVEHQRETIRALATPLIQVWDGVVCLPIVGMLDSDRTTEITHTLLNGIVQHKASFAVLDLTGVEVVDTTTADFLLRVVKTTRLLGVEGILCGIHPAVSQAMVHLGVELAAIRTMRTLRDAVRYCIAMGGRRAGT